MRAMTIRFLTLAIGAAAAISVVTAAEGETSTRHVRKHHAQHSHGLQNHGLQNHRFGNSLAAGEARPIAPQVGGADVCPGLARGIDCKVWPPPVVDDPDRKNGGGDGAM